MPTSKTTTSSAPAAAARVAARLPLLVMAMLSLLGGVLAGLARLGWGVPPLAANAAGWHAALVIGAFFGAVISLERAVALGAAWAYLAPAAAGLAGVLLLAGTAVSQGLAPALAIAAALTLCAASMQVLRRQAAPFTLVLALGALCWLLGNLGWAIAGVNAALPWWLAFLILTIAGERLELTRFLPTPPVARRLFLAIVAAVLNGAALSHWNEALGLRLFALGLLALALWLLRYDIARRNVRQHGLVRFIAACLISGYAWLALAGVLGLLGALQAGHAWRDAALHAIGFGFVFSMVFGHAPIILPAVTRLKLPYHAGFYVPLLALHLSLALRVAGSLAEASAGAFALRQAGGLANAAALALFVATIVTGIVRARRRPTPAPKVPA